MPDLSFGDWYGCAGCGHYVCPPCGRAAGRRCEECGGTLELNRHFPTVIRPRGEWRDFIGESEGMGPQVDSAQLIALVTEHSLPEIDHGLSEACRELFLQEVFRMELSCRLGNLDYLVDLNEPRETRLTPEWKRSLRLVVDYYVSRVPSLGQDLELAEVLRGLRWFQPLARPCMGALRAALHSESQFVRQELLAFLQEQPPLSRAWLWSEVLLLLRSGKREEGAFGLEVLRAALGDNGVSLGFRLETQVIDRVLYRLSQASEEQLGAVWKALMSNTAGESQNLTALLVVTLGLTSEILPLLLQPQKKRHLWNRAVEFLGELREAAAETVPELLKLSLEPSQADRTVLIRTLGKVGAGDPSALAFLREHLGAGELTHRQAAFTTLLKLHRVGKVEWSEPLAQGGLAVVREALAQGQLTWLIETLEGFPTDWRRRVLPRLEELEGMLLERFAQHEELPSVVISLGKETLRRVVLASPVLHIRLLEHARASPNSAVTQDFLAAVGPETPAALLLIQRRLLERDIHPWSRLGSVELLGSLVGKHSSPAEALLLDLFLAESEEVEIRWSAAKALAPAAGRLQGHERLVPLLQHEAALIRGWAYLLLGENGAVHERELARDPSPAVRQLAVLREDGNSGE